MNKTSRDCGLIEQLILKSQLEKLTTEETERLNTHLQNCPDCRGLHLNLSNLQKSLVMTKNDLPLPRPEIRLLLLKQLNELKLAEKKSPNSVMEILKKILNHPIPLYRVAAGFIVIVCITVFIMNIFSKNNIESDMVRQAYSVKDNVYEQYINYFPDQVTLPQKVGINVAEDTSFKSIRFSAL
jgi:hypothetical protein